MQKVSNENCIKYPYIYNEVTLITTPMMDIGKLEKRRTELNEVIHDHNIWTLVKRNIKEIKDERDLITKRLSVLYYRTKDKEMK